MKFKSTLYFEIFFVSFFLSNAENVEINTSSGVVRGQTIKVLNQTVRQFLGIPFAEPPVGSLRFAKPKPISKPLEGIIDATKPKNSCIQSYRDYVGNMTISEDCLVLNIWSQKAAEKPSLKPVMFWIYGGGLSAGSIFQTNFNGSVLATNDVVFVSTNYRLGALGFLYSGDESAPGNVGFYDQLLALKWVRDNIHLFGGDKNQITIFGQSAGSESVAAQILSPLTKGLFKRAIMQSGAAVNIKTKTHLKEESIENAKLFAKQLNCTDSKLWLECLKKVDAKNFTPINNKITNFVDGTEFLPLSTQKAFSDGVFNKNLDLMAGVAKDEGSNLAGSISSQIYTKNLTKEDFKHFVNMTDKWFHGLNVENTTEFYLNNINLNDSNAIKWRIFDFFGDIIIKCPTYLFSKWYAIHSAPETNVFFYELTHAAVGAQPWDKVELGICHGSDMPFVFGLLLLNPNSTTKENIEFSKEIVQIWTDFAKTGKPDSNWPKLIDTKTHSSVTQIKDLNPKNLRKYFIDLFDDNCDGFWTHIF